MCRRCYTPEKVPQLADLAAAELGERAGAGHHARPEVVSHPAALVGDDEAGMYPLGPPEDRPWGGRTFNVIDPDGNNIEFAGG